MARRLQWVLVAHPNRIKNMTNTRFNIKSSRTTVKRLFVAIETNDSLLPVCDAAATDCDDVISSKNYSFVSGFIYLKHETRLGVLRGGGGSFCSKQTEKPVHNTSTRTRAQKHISWMKCDPSASLLGCSRTFVNRGNYVVESNELMPGSRIPFEVIIK